MIDTACIIDIVYYIWQIIGIGVIIIFVVPAGIIVLGLLLIVCLAFLIECWPVAIVFILFLIYQKM